MTVRCKQGVNGTPQYKPGDECPAGWTPAPIAAPAPGTPGSTTPSTTSPSGSNIPMAWFPRPNGQTGPMGTSDLYAGKGNVPAIQNPNSSIYNTTMPRSDVITAWEMLPLKQQQQIDRIAKSIDYRGTGRSLWERASNASALSVEQGRPMTPYSFINRYAIEGASSSSSGGGGGGGGGAAAPVAAGPDSMKRMMDALSMDMLGRTLSDKEFKRYYGSYKGAFAGNPAVDTQQHGMDALQRNDDYQEFQVASKFATAMKSVIEGAA